MSLTSRSFRLVAIAAMLVLLAIAGTASAHVEVTAGATAGEIVVSVPNESSSADTVSVAVQIPDNVVRTQVPDVTGWTHTETTVPLDPPLMVDGTEVSSRVSTVTWSGGKLPPGQDAEFRLRLAVANGTTREGLAFPAVQRYSDGDVVRWIGPPGSDLPAGVLATALPAVAVATVTTTPATTTSTPATTSTATTSTGATDTGGSDNPAGLIFALVGIAIAIVGVVAIIRWRRTRPETDS